MSNNSSIEWTDVTWNPLAGCTRASEGCDHCYAAGMSIRLEAMANKDIADGKDPGGKAKYIGIATKNKSGIAMFNGRINLDEAALDEPYHWRKPRLVFVNSMSDLFHKDVPFEFVAKVFAVMEDTPQHTYQVLTKRPERMLSFQRNWYPFGLPANVWAMTSVENQQTANERIPSLLEVIAAVRGLSMEPLLGSVDLFHVDAGEVLIDCLHGHYGVPDFPQKECDSIHWVIAGGESGAHARPMNIKWVYDIRDQCVAAGIPFLFKQHGAWIPYPEVAEWKTDQALVERYGMSEEEAVGWVVKEEWRDHIMGNDKWGVVQYDGKFLPQTTTWNHRQMAECDDYEHTVYRVGKKAAGRLLEGRAWTQFPRRSEQCAD